MGNSHGGLNDGSDPRNVSRELKGGPGAQEQKWPGSTREMEPRPDHGEESYRGTGKLEGKTALITGGDSGIGRAIAIAFAREGADVAIGYLSEDADAEETLAWIRKAGRRALAIRSDLSRPEECERTVKETVAAFGRIDVLVNNAAFQCEQERLEDIPVDQIERTFRTNILGYIYVARAALPHIPPGGSILNTGSVTAMAGNPGLIDYSATKGAIHTFTKSLALAIADRGIRVNCVAPGPVWTPLIPSTFGGDHVGKFGGSTAWERPAQPAEIAPSYVFLASDDGRYYTGEVLGPTGKATTR